MILRTPEPLIYICTNEDCADFEERYYVARVEDFDPRCPTCSREGKEWD